MADETILECLKGYVQVAPPVCEQPGPAVGEETDTTSGVFLTELPGMTLERIEKIADRNTRNLEGVWEKVELRSLRKFKTAVLVQINKCLCISDPDVIDCLVCSNRKLFALAFCYLAASEMCYEGLYSSAINRFTTIEREDFENLRNDFLADFQVELKNAVNAINLCDSDCITEDTPPGGNVTWIETRM